MERKIRKLLKRHTSIGSSDEVEEINQDIQAVTTEVRSTKSNTIISILSVYPGESYPPVNPENCVMSIIRRNCKVVNKQNAPPELFNLRKLGVALKSTNTPKKRSPGQIAAPPTPWDLKRKLLANRPSSPKGTTGTYQSTAGKQKKCQIRDNVEDSESDEDDYLPLATKIQATEPKGSNPGTNIEGERQGTSSGGQ